MKLKPATIDGTTLEGGGQLFRVAVGLSSISGRPVHVSKIRGLRAKGTKPAGGLKSVHLAGLAWLVRATSAEVEGAELGSSEVLFNPFNAVDHDSKKYETMWKRVAKAGVNVKISEHSDDSQIEIETPGSTLLILQAILPFILFRWNGPRVKPVRVRVQGGTNVWNSLSYDYAEQVLFPTLHQHLGIGPITMELVRRGWSTGRRSVGEVVFTIPPLPVGSKLPAFHLDNRGDVTKIEAFFVAPASKDGWWSTSISEELQKQCNKKIPGVQVITRRDEGTHDKGKLYLMLVAHTSNGYRIARDHLYGRSFKDESMGVVREVVGSVTSGLQKELQQDVCVDEHMQDQLVVFQALAEGRSTVNGMQPGSLHTQTVRWVAEQMLGVKFDDCGSCDGVGFAWDQEDASQAR